MAKRKYPKVRPAVKLTEPIPGVSFHCLCCDHDTGVLCYMYFDDRVGELSCRICHALYSTMIDKDSTEPIDIYEEWLEKCKQTDYADANPWKQFAELKLDGQANSLKKPKRLPKDDEEDCPVKKLAKMRLD
ncbi:transcription elongation factor 1 homolog [Phoenix dactylifera]|uniref:Transcription elongation factor 1 homolog n=1 Tax=Phoenix dactylifera TaxID=42345 RepID=A0A8B9A2A9_PHODC|nr:transcription elongation factor 1 homolog [Phoenix dactylifera]